MYLCAIYIYANHRDRSNSIFYVFLEHVLHGFEFSVTIYFYNHLLVDFAQFPCITRTRNIFSCFLIGFVIAISVAFDVCHRKKRHVVVFSDDVFQPNILRNRFEVMLKTVRYLPMYWHKIWIRAMLLCKPRFKVIQMVFRIEILWMDMAQWIFSGQFQHYHVSWGYVIRSHLSDTLFFSI